MVSTLECDERVLSSIHSSGELITWAENMFRSDRHVGEVSCSGVSKFGICGVAQSLEVLMKVMHI